MADQSITGEVDALPYTIWPSMRRDPSDDKDSHVYRRSVALQRKSSADSLSDRIDNIKRVDRIIEQLLEARNLECGSQIDLHRSDIKFLCREGRKTFTSQPILLELLAPTTVSLNESLKADFFLELTALGRQRYSWAVLRSTQGV